MAFDLVLRGGLLIDGSGAPARTADVGVTGDRIAAIGDLSAVPDADVATVIDATGHVVSPGFVDPHGHSDGSVLLDGALASHLRQGFTTQLSGNCGYTYAADGRRRAGDARRGPRRASGSTRRWTTFGGLPGRGRAAADGPERRPARRPRDGPLGRAGSRGTRADRGRARGDGPPRRGGAGRGRVGLSSGLIYAPGVHAAPDEVAALVAVAARRDALYATHMRNEAAGVLDALDEAIVDARAWRASSPHRPARLQVSHLKAGAQAVWGTGGRPGRAARGGPPRRPRRRGRPVPVHGGRDDPVDDPAAGDPRPVHRGRRGRDPRPAESRAPIRDLMRDGISRLGERRRSTRAGTGSSSRAARRGRSGTAARSRPSPTTSAGTRGARARRPRRRPALGRHRHPLHGRAGRRDDHARALDRASAPTPRVAARTTRSWARASRTRAPTARRRACSATTCATGASSPLETAVAKLSAVPAARVGPHATAAWSARAGCADLVVFDPATVADLATYERPARYPAGIRDVIVNGRLAVRDGLETGERPGRLLRRARMTRRRGASAARSSRPSSSRGCPGGDLAYMLRRSPRSRRLRVTIVPERGVVVSIPPAAPARLGAPGAARRPRSSPSARTGSAATSRRQEATRARLDDRPDARRRPASCRTSASRTASGSSPRAPGLRASRVSRVGGDEGDELLVERAARDRRDTAARSSRRGSAPAPARLIDAAIVRHARALGVTPARITIRDTTSRWGSCSRTRQPVVLLAPRPRAARGARRGRRPRAVPPAGVRARARVLSRCSRRASPTTRRGAAGCGRTPPELHAALD